MKSYLEKLEEYNHQLVLENKRLARECNALVKEGAGEPLDRGSDEYQGATVIKNGAENTKDLTPDDNQKIEEGFNEEVGPETAAKMTPETKAALTAAHDKLDAEKAAAGVAECGGAPAAAPATPAAPAAPAAPATPAAAPVEEAGKTTVTQANPAIDAAGAAAGKAVSEDDDGAEDDADAVIAATIANDGEGGEAATATATATPADGEGEGEEGEEGEDGAEDLTVVDDDVPPADGAETASTVIVPITDEIKQKIIDLGVETAESDCRFSIRFENEEDPKFVEVLKLLADNGITGAVAATDFGTYIAVGKECPEGGEGEEGGEENGAIEVIDDEPENGGAPEEDTIEVIDDEGAADPNGEDDVIEVVDEGAFDRTKEWAKRGWEMGGDIGTTAGAVGGGLAGGLGGLAAGGPVGAAVGATGGTVLGAPVGRAAGKVLGGLAGGAAGLVGDLIGEEGAEVTEGSDGKDGEEKDDEFKYTKTLAKGGALAGAGLGAVGGAQKGAAAPNPDLGKTATAAARGLGGAVGGAVGGAALGAGVGLAADAVRGVAKKLRGKKDEKAADEKKEEVAEGEKKPATESLGGMFLGGLIGGAAGQFLGSEIPGGVGEWAGNEAFNVGGVGINNGALAGAGIGALAGAALDHEDESLEVREAKAETRIRENALLTRKEFMKKDDEPIPESIQRMLKTNKKLFAGK